MVMTARAPLCNYARRLSSRRDLVMNECDVCELFAPTSTACGRRSAPTTHRSVVPLPVRRPAKLLSEDVRRCSLLGRENYNPNLTPSDECSCRKGDRRSHAAPRLLRQTIASGAWPQPAPRHARGPRLTSQPMFSAGATVQAFDPGPSAWRDRSRGKGALADKS